MICQMVNMLGLLFGDVLAKMIVTSAPIWSEIHLTRGILVTQYSLLTDLTSSVCVMLSLYLP